MPIKTILLISAILTTGIGIYGLSAKKITPAVPVQPQAQPLQQTGQPPQPKCVSKAGLPDKTCTPGKTDPRVTQTNIQQTICVKGYTQTVRPQQSYTYALKVNQMKLYGLTGKTSEYEEDHLVPLELGGDPKDPLNLWPQYGIPNEKDTLENQLHKLVCTHQLTLQEGQQAIRTNWLTAYQKYVK